MRQTFCIVLATLGLSFSLQTANAVDYFVSPAGLDTAGGTIDAPFQTLARAQRAVRENKAGAPFNVYLRGGSHYLSEPLVFTSDDSGRADAPVVWQAWKDEHPVISGGQLLPKLDWHPYRDGIVQAKVSTDVITDQLFVNGELQHLARYPNYDPNVTIYNGYAADAISPERAARWADPTGGFIHMMHGSLWGGYHYVITGKDASGKLLYEGGWQNNRGGPIHKEYRFVENIFEELDAPGEWFLNRKTSTLYFYPPPNLDLAGSKIETVRLKELVELKGSELAPVRFVNFKGITFRHALRTFMENREPMLLTDWTMYRGGAVFINGAQDCSLIDCDIDRVGGTGVHVNNYNRRITIKGCHITSTGGNGIVFVGDPAAVRDARTWKTIPNVPVSKMDSTPGPKTSNYPAECLVEDCLINRTGRVEKQTAPVEIDMAQDITVRHCSIYDVPRAGINIGDGCWGGHVIEYCDVFDTVKETGDHGSFNSWGRDRYWGRTGWNVKSLGEKQYLDVALLDVVKPITLHDNRWRCDHGWDVDLDDGSSNYRIYNNLFLHGGLKLREGFSRVAENNIMVNNGLHPHVWYELSGDVVRHNIFMAGYRPANIKHWDAQLNSNLFPDEKTLAEARKLDNNDADSIAGDPQFINPAAGDYRVKDGSAALTMGFKNFPMDQFGVQSPRLRAIARTPQLVNTKIEPVETIDKSDQPWLGGTIRNLGGDGDQSAYGLPVKHAVLVVKADNGSGLAKLGLRAADTIVEINDKKIGNVAELKSSFDALTGKSNWLIVRQQDQLRIDVNPPAK